MLSILELGTSACNQRASAHLRVVAVEAEGLGRNGGEAIVRDSELTDVSSSRVA